MGLELIGAVIIFLLLDMMLFGGAITRFIFGFIKLIILILVVVVIYNIYIG